MSAAAAVRRWAAAGAAAALAAGAQLAAAEFWITVGAYRSQDAAERMAANAGARTELRFQALATDGGDGALYRVVNGPYPRRDDAKFRMPRVRKGGFDEAWIVVVDAPSGAADAGGDYADLLRDAADIGGDIDDLLGGVDSGEVGDLLGDVDALLEGLDDDSWASDLPPIEVLLRDLPDVPAQEIPTLLEEEPEEAEVVVPENYRLNRLRRGDDRRPDAAGRDPPGAFDMRLKWYTTAQSLPSGDVLRQSAGKATPVDHNADLRVMWQPSFGPFKAHVAYAANWLQGDSLARAGSPGLTFDQTPSGDERRMTTLTWKLGGAGDGRRRLHRFDRLALEYRSRQWAVAAGRQAVSWGGGLVFQTMDLFNPFAPTTIDQDYKAGDDLILVERLFDGGGELQALAVGRRAPDGDIERASSSFAAKFRGMTGAGNEYELMASRHYGDSVLGAGARIPAGGALIRSDITWTRTEERLVLSGLLNADYSFAVGEAVVHVFGEFFHNGMGVTRLPDDLAKLPPPLIARIGRGELFNMMRNYLAAGTSFRWHFLVNQSVAVIANLHDASYVAQASLTYDASDSSRLQVGVTKPFGDPGDEFGGVAVGEGLTAGGGARGFMRFVYFF